MSMLNNACPKGGGESQKEAWGRGGGVKGDVCMTREKENFGGGDLRGEAQSDIKAIRGSLLPYHHIVNAPRVGVVLPMKEFSRFGS